MCCTTTPSWQGGPLRAPVASPRPVALPGIEPDQRQRNVSPFHHSQASGRCTAAQGSLQAPPRPPWPTRRRWITTGAFAPLDPRPELCALDRTKGDVGTPLDPIDRCFGTGFEQREMSALPLHTIGQGAFLPPGPLTHPRGQPFAGWMSPAFHRWTTTGVRVPSSIRRFTGTASRHLSASPLRQDPCHRLVASLEISNCRGASGL